MWSKCFRTRIIQIGNKNEEPELLVETSFTKAAELRHKANSSQKARLLVSLINPNRLLVYFGELSTYIIYICYIICKQGSRYFSLSNLYATSLPRLIALDNTFSIMVNGSGENGS